MPAARTIDSVLKKLRKHPSAETHRGATDDELRYFAKISGRKLPASYTTFLKEVGFADLGSDTIYGLGPDATKATSVLENMVTESTMANPPMLSYLIPLMNDGAGNHYCLDTRRIKAGDCPVVLWVHDDPLQELQKPERVASSFCKWLDKLLDETP